MQEKSWMPNESYGVMFILQQPVTWRILKIQKNKTTKEKLYGWLRQM